MYFFLTNIFYFITRQINKIPQHFIEKNAASIKAKYYVIRRGAGGQGFFSNYKWVMAEIIFAVQNEMIPVVDMKHWRSHYQNGTYSNGWTIFFEQPFGVDLKEVYREKHNYILSPLHEYRYEIADIFSREYGMPTSKAVTYLNPYIEKYMHIKPDIINPIRNRCHHIFTRYEYVLGIHYRGTDMRVEHDGHFISKNENEYVKQVGQHIEHLSTKKTALFIASDEMSVIKLFHESFPQLDIITNTSYRANDSNTEGIHNSKSHIRKNHRILLGKEVIEDAYFLSKCNSLVCGKSNVSAVAIIWNNNQYDQLTIL